MEIKLELENFITFNEDVLKASSIGLKDGRAIINNRFVYFSQALQNPTVASNSENFFIQRIRKTLFIINVFFKKINFVLKINYKI